MQNRPDKDKLRERALLIAIEFPDDSPQETATLLDELEELTRTSGLEIGGKEHIKVRKKYPGLLMGSGKAEEMMELAKAKKCDVIIFDHSLSPVQQRNWEEACGIPCIDRQEIILDIFGQRARTREAVLQVQLARAEYELPRLLGAWTHLSRQRGGGAMQRGEGEKQIEVDRRMVRKRITKLKKELEEVLQHREVQRKRRVKIPLPSAAIVGYTNAGKSSLLNTFTGAEILAEDKLFATLDPTTRRLKLPNGQILLLTDTVGFVRRLPHRLVDAFKATLEEAVVADFLVHVVDLASPDIEHHMETTQSVMEELGADTKHTLTVFNKIDLIDDPLQLSALRAKHPEALFISTQEELGLDKLLEAMEGEMAKKSQYLELLFPHGEYKLLGQLHAMGAIEEEKHTDEGIEIKANIPVRFLDSIQKFIRS